MKELGEAYVSTACKVHVAVEVMSNRGAESERRRESRSERSCRVLGREGNVSGRAKANPMDDTATPAVEATSYTGQSV